MAVSRDDLKHAVDLVRTGDWHGAHTIVQQDETDQIACWLHACLHKIEGDDGNARYWYRRTGGRAFDDFADASEELKAIHSLFGEQVAAGPQVD